jgi:hypothetical protein
MIYQKERRIEFRLTDKEQKAMDRHKTMFRDFVPVITGDFIVSIVFVNNTAKEYFSHEEKVSVTNRTVPVLVGYKTAEIGSGAYEPFSIDTHKMFSDPRWGFNKSDSLVGIVVTATKPEVRLVRRDHDGEVVEITDIEKTGGGFVFRRPLVDLSSSYYDLIIRNRGTEVYKTMISVYPMTVEKPRSLEWSDPPSAGDSYAYELAQQYLNAGDLESALASFEKLPRESWDAKTRPVMARAYYQKRDYEKVLELLEDKNVKKDYAVLLMLGNASLELKRLDKAGDYFEQLRSYGDTVKINEVLGAIFLARGDRKRAEAYFERARRIQNEKDVKKDEEPQRKRAIG